MQVEIAPVGGGYLISPARNPSRLLPTDAVLFESSGVAGADLIATSMSFPGYLFIDQESARWLMRGCELLPQSHPLRRPHLRATVLDTRRKPPLLRRAGTVLTPATLARREQEARRRTGSAGSEEK